MKKKLMLSINSWDDLQLISHLQPDYVKLPSPESLDFSLAKRILSHSYNLVISTGVISDSELEEVTTHLRPLINSTNSLTILHCVSEYPTDFTNVNLSRLIKFKSIAPWASFGISDHSNGDHVPLLALGYGITMIEKHIMPSHKDFQSLDSSFSMTTSEFLDMARKISLSLVIMGSEKDITVPNSVVQEKFWQNRISAHASSTIEAGQIVSPEDVVFFRPGDGLSPLCVQKYFGKKLSRRVPSGCPLKESDFL